MTNYEKIDKLLRNNKGYITSKDIKNNYIASWFLTDYIRKNDLVKIFHGFYALNSWYVDDYFIFQRKYPKYIFSFQSALYLNELTDRIPFQIEVSRKKGYNPRSKKGNEIIHTIKDEYYELGITEIFTMHGNKVKVYDAERTICDLIKYRDKQDSEIFVKAINLYNKSTERNLSKLLKYADTMGIKEKVYKIFEVIAYED